MSDTQNPKKAENSPKAAFPPSMMDFWDGPASPFMTSRMEVDIHDLRVRGTIPEEFRGAYFTVGPEPQYKPREDIRHHLLNGDGIVSALYFGEGKVSYKSRFVRTDRFKLQEASGKALFGEYRNPYTDDPACEGTSAGTANTTMWWYGGKLQAMKEESPPFEVNPTTLETIGMMDYDGEELLGPNMSAHPKYCGNTGQMINVGNMAEGPDTGSPDFVYYIFSPDGKIIKKERFTGPYCCVMHDFLISENYIIMFYTPAICRVENMKNGGWVWEWEDDQPSHISLIPRNGSAKDAIWIETEARFWPHFFNAYEKDGIIIADTTENKHMPAILSGDMGMSKMGEEWKPNCWPVRFEIDPKTGTYKTTRMFDNHIELSRVDERYWGMPYRYGYSPFVDEAYPTVGPVPGAANAISRLDFETGEVSSFYVGEGGMSLEPIFVPRSKDAPQDDGFLAGYVLRESLGRAEFMIFDAGKIEEGPVATVEIPYPMSFRIHANWLRADEFEMPK